MKLGEVRSLVPGHVNLMALTATATKATRTFVIEKLGMCNPVLVYKSPNKPNIKYVVKNKQGCSISEIMAPLVSDLRKERQMLPRVIVFGKTYETCGELFMLFKSQLGDELTEPITAPNDLAHFRLVDMFTAALSSTLKRISKVL